MSETIRARFLKDWHSWVPGAGHVDGREGQTAELAAEAVYWLELQGVVEPVLDFPAFAPALPGGGVDPWQAWRLHVEGYPVTGCPGVATIADLLRGPWQVGRFLYVTHYRNPPTWGTAKPRPSWRSARAPTNLEESYRRCSQAVHMAAAQHHYIERLARGELAAQGVWEDDLPNLGRKPIDKGWWRRTIGLDMGAAQLFEATDAVGDHRERRFSEVSIMDASEVRVSEASSTAEAPPVRSKGGAPSAKPEIVAAARRLKDQGKDPSKMGRTSWAKCVAEECGQTLDARGYSEQTIRRHCGKAGIFRQSRR